MLFPRCGMRPVTFLPQGLRLSTGFWAFAPPLPDRRHVIAMPVPQIRAAEHPPVIKCLPESR
jgi:hypothetical protein